MRTYNKSDLDARRARKIRSVMEYCEKRKICCGCSNLIVRGIIRVPWFTIRDGRRYRVYYNAGKRGAFADRSTLAMARATACGHARASIYYLKPYE